MKRTRITAKDLSSMIEKFGSHMTCWKVGLYYGSAVHFELGEKRLQKMRRPPAEFIGSACLALWMGYWDIYERDVELTHHNIITREYAESELSKKFVGQRLMSFEEDPQERRVTVSFTGDLKIRIWTDDTTDVSDLFFFRLPDDTYVNYDVKDRFFISK